MKTSPNLSHADRVSRLLICCALILLTLTVNSHVDHPGSFALLSIFFYTTALLSWDPFYDFLGISTYDEAAPQTTSIEKVTQAGTTTPVKPVFVFATGTPVAGMGTSAGLGVASELQQITQFDTEAA